MFRRKKVIKNEDGSSFDRYEFDKMTIDGPGGFGVGMDDPFEYADDYTYLEFRIVYTRLEEVLDSLQRNFAVSKTFSAKVSNLQVHDTYEEDCDNAKITVICDSGMFNWTSYTFFIEVHK